MDVGQNPGRLTGSGPQLFFFFFNKQQRTNKVRLCRRFWDFIKMPGEEFQRKFYKHAEMQRSTIGRAPAGARTRPDQTGVVSLLVSDLTGFLVEQLQTRRTTLSTFDTKFFVCFFLLLKEGRVQRDIKLFNSYFLYFHVTST